MKNLIEYSPLELLKLINDGKEKHENLKKEINKDLDEIDRINELINDKLKLIEETENQYVLLMEELSKRNKKETI